MSDTPSMFGELLKKTFVIPDDALVALDEDTFIEFGRMKELTRMAIALSRMASREVPKVQISAKKKEAP